MKKTFLALLLTGSACAYAGMMGFLVHSEAATSVTGKLVYRCTYSVAGNNTTVILPNICPPSMNFE